MGAHSSTGCRPAGPSLTLASGQMSSVCYQLGFCFISDGSDVCALHDPYSLVEAIFTSGLGIHFHFRVFSAQGDHRAASVCKYLTSHSKAFPVWFSPYSVPGVVTATSRKQNGVCHGLGQWGAVSGAELSWERQTSWRCSVGWVQNNRKVLNRTERALAHSNMVTR